VTIASTSARRFRTRGAADFLGLATNTLEKWRIAGKGPAFSKIGGAVVYDERDLESFLVACRRTSTSEDAPSS
jgi:hypothetical protein